jgi:hypothetical protein
MSMCVGIPAGLHFGRCVLCSWCAPVAVGFHSVYSRGYKKRAIDEKMFETSPIFNYGLDCRLFVFKPQFDISRQLIFVGGGSF